jgi:hypothetical protein
MTVKSKIVAAAVATSMTATGSLAGDAVVHSAAAHHTGGNNACFPQIPPFPSMSSPGHHWGDYSGFDKDWAHLLFTGADWERYSQSTTCFHDNNSGQQPPSAEAEGIDCTGLVYKVWGIHPAGNSQDTYRYLDPEQNTRTYNSANFYTGTLAGPATVSWGKYKTASQAGHMDNVNWDGGGGGAGHSAIIVTNQGNGYYSTFEAVGSFGDNGQPGTGYYGTGMNVGHFNHFIDFSAHAWSGQFRNHWVTFSYP